MHCLWGLKQNGLAFEMKGGTSLSKGWHCIDRFSEDIDIQFEPPDSLDRSGKSKKGIRELNEFYDLVESKIDIPGISVDRLPNGKGESGAKISLTYNPICDPDPVLKDSILLEAGFANTAPNEKLDISSWALDRVLDLGIPVTLNRAEEIVCFNPEYTFVEKLQAVCRKFLRLKEADLERKYQPQQYIRHYYDLYKLLELPRVTSFLGSPEYKSFKQKEFREAHLKMLESKEPFKLSDPATRDLFESEYAVLNGLFYGERPTFGEVIGRLSKYADQF